MKIFYGIHIEEPEGLILDLMRLVLEPSFFRKSHITLRGPYNENPKKTRKWLDEEVNEVLLGSAGRFNSRIQNTVYFSCISDKVKELSWKKDYRDAVSHITIYDGKDSEFAEEIFRIASSYDLLVPLKTSNLVKLGKKIAYQYDLLFTLEKANYIYNSIFGVDIDYDILNSASSTERLSQFKALFFALRELSSNYKNSTFYQAIA